MPAVDGKWSLWLTLVLGCAPTIPADYARYEAVAEAATARRDHGSAAAAWANAAAVAETETDRQEAVYRQATSALRAGDTATHQRLLTSLAQSPGSRRERAVYDLATAEFNRDPPSGRVALRAAILEFPSSGLARAALERWVGSLDVQERSAALAALLPKIDDPALRERILVLRAHSFEAIGDTEQALQVYEQQVAEFPYPRGRYWDESLLRISVLHYRRGDVSRAVATLESMLSFRERATIVGSYERRYADATLLLAYHLLRDVPSPDTSASTPAHVGWARAYGLLRRFPSEHPDSRHQDDALWAALLLSNAQQLKEQTCDAAATLIAGWPDSRYSPCAVHYCPAAKAEGTCRPYVISGRNSARATLEIVLRKVLEPPK